MVSLYRNILAKKNEIQFCQKLKVTYLCNQL